jgi:hypothetical protein
MKTKNPFEIKTFEEVCVQMGENPKNYETDSTNPRVIGSNQMNRIALIYEFYQQGKQMDPNNIRQLKWFPVWDLEISPSNPSGFRFDDSGCTHSGTYSVLGPLLWSPDEKTSDYVAKTYESEFRKLILINK